MMTFVFKGRNPHSEQERKDAIDFFIRYIGDLKPEFEENDVTVEVNMDAKGSENKYIFTSNKIMIGALVWKVQEYRKTHPFHG